MSGTPKVRTTKAAAARFLLAGLVWLGPMKDFGDSLRAAPAAGADTPTLLLVVGAAGEPEFGSNFVQQAALWKATAAQAGAPLLTIGTETGGELNDREQLQQRLAAETTNTTGALWLILVGHGTFDGKEARFNLRGPDVSPLDLAEWLKPVQRPLVIINTASASAPFLEPLSASNRVVITATRSGNEQNFTRFGHYLATAFRSPQSDFDKDGQTSLLEAFLSAAAGTAEFYHTEGRLATEHALLDDNGDGLGTPADWFRGVRAVKKAKDGTALDGIRAHQIHLILSPAELALPVEVRRERDTLELEIASLRERKAEFSETKYDRDLEALLLKLARLYELETNRP